ncbi:MAG: CHAT domain-containing protein, partial [Anaerolineae bacterium]
MVEMMYLDFDLLIERSETGYRARVLNSPAGQATTDLASTIAQTDTEEFLADIGRPQRGILRDARRTGSPKAEARDAVTAFGARLFAALFAGEVGTCLRRSLDEAHRQSAGLRIRLRLTDVPELADLPWEYLYDPTSRDFLTLSVETPLVRYLDLPHRIEPLAVQPPLRILVVIAGPTDYVQLDADQEWLALQQALSELEGRGRIALERLDETTIPALQQRLRQGEYNVFHFIGHGTFDEQRQEGVLLMEDEGHRGRPMSTRYLGTLLRDERRTLRLAVLNACKGARTSRGDPFTGLAQGLVQKGIPAVIAMQFEITDEAAITLAQEFYRAIADGYPVDAALAEARKAIYLQGNEVEWGTPVLYMRSPDGRIFDFEGLSDQELTPTKVDVPPRPSEPGQDSDGLSGKVERPASDRDLKNILEKLNQRRLVLFIGADLPESVTGLPSRQSLADALAVREGIAPGQRLASVAQQVMSHGNRWDFTNFLMQTLEAAGMQPGPFYQKLAQLIKVARPDLIITTAYHRLLELALQNLGDFAFNTVVRDDALHFADPSWPTLLKLYGDLQQVDTLVVTEQDQNALLRGRDKGDMVDEVRRAFRRNSVLFLGYDLGDPAVSALFDEVAGDRFQIRSYAVWSGLSQPEVGSFESNRGLAVLDTDPVAFV